MQLQISRNRHYLEMADGVPFLWLGDTQWTLNKHSDEQIIQILDDRKVKGFSIIQVSLVRDWNSVYYKDLSWVRTDYYDNEPFVENNVTVLNPAYWERWKWICDQVNDRGMFFVGMAGYPGRLEGKWRLNGVDECYIYGKNVGRVFQECSGIIFSPSMDYPGDRGVGVKGFRAIAKGILDGMRAECTINTEKSSINVPLTYHTWQTSSDWFHQDDWLFFNGVQGSRNEVADNDLMIYQRIIHDYQKDEPVKPVVCLEGSYEGERNNECTLPATTARNVRMQLFYAFFAGAAGYTYGHVDNWIQHESIDYLNSQGGNWIPVIKDFLIARQWWKFVPCQKLIISGEGLGEKRKVATVTNDSSECCIYFPEIEPIEINVEEVFGNNTIEIFWFDPRSGLTTEGEHMEAKGNKHFSPPQNWEDAVLIIKSKK